MSKELFLSVFLVTLLLFGCNVDNEVLRPQTPAHVEVPNVGTVSTGSIVVKMKEEIPQTKAIIESLGDLEIYSIKKLFPTDPRFEERHRDAGLHLWYHITFNPETPVTKAYQDISTIEGADIVEYLPAIKPAQVLSNPFNDPKFDSQWHYHNTAAKDGYVAGADINLLKAWNLETGDESVIVAIIDSGVDYEHEDLKDAMWVNEAELNGESGVDDDNNGYEDDIHGYNFAVAADGSSMQGVIKPQDHGTHVAGTVGAVNNNGKHGAGIAGGNGSQKGVRLMSCQTICENSAAYISPAFIYAANNGAVISQNSWSIDVTETPKHILDGIDYFINNAGLDAKGNQIGPMAGGVVIFAAGNDNITTGHPAMYDKVIAVASTGPSGAKASYSNYGSWVDIAAPGGENQTTPYGNVYSTMTGNSFGQMSGTSMACPHVSGVAALMVSKFGGPGYTNEMLWNKLLESADEEKLYSNDINSKYEGLLGVGALDAYAALYEADVTAPDPVETIDVVANANSLTVKWIASATNGKSTFGYNLYYSKKDLGSYSPSVKDEEVAKVFVTGGTVAVGDELSYTISGLEFSTSYYFRVEAISASNVSAALSPQVSAVTGKNDPPVLSPGTTVEATLKSFEVREFRFTVTEPNNHKYSHSLKGGAGASASQDQATGEIVVKLEAPKANAGTYVTTLTVTDEYGMSSSVDINYTVLENFAPVAVGSIPNILIQKGEVKEIKLSDYFSDEDGETLTYSVKSSSASKVVEMTVAGDILKLKGNWYGATTITVTGSDAKAAKAETSFDILLRDNAVPLDIYPNPVQTTLNIRTANLVSANITITGISGAEVFTAKDVAIDPFNPYAVDATSWDPGNYSVEVNVNGEVTRRSIVKL